MEFPAFHIFIASSFVDFHLSYPFPLLQEQISPIIAYLLPKLGNFNLTRLQRPCLELPEEEGEGVRNCVGLSFFSWGVSSRGGVANLGGFAAL